MVGRNLGGALVTLLHSMREFRSTPGSNVDDLLKYMRQSQYLDMVEAPIHATAALHIAETFHLGSLYKQAFAHCVGMHDRLFYSSEYQVRKDTPSRAGITHGLFYLFLPFFDSNLHQMLICSHVIANQCGIAIACSQGSSGDERNAPANVQQTSELS
jgi:hypothetical protein